MSKTSLKAFNYDAKGSKSLAKLNYECTSTEPGKYKSRGTRFRGHETEHNWKEDVDAKELMG